MRDPAGYLNVRKVDEQGRELRGVEIGPERAPLIAWAFERYATGEISVGEPMRDLTARGLTTVPSPKRPSKPLGRATFYALLTNPYHAGVIRYEGALPPGAHEHSHHLKGLLHCGTCGSRMLLDFATNPRGTTCAYFVCSGRAAR